MALEPAQRREARVAMAMLPVGATLAVLSLLAVPVLVVFLIVSAVGGRPWDALWFGCAALVALRNGVKGIEIMSAFDWRPLPFALALWCATVAAYPGWW